MPSVSSYTNNAAVLALYPAVGSATAINSATIFQFVTDATNEIDGRIAERYGIPLSVSSGASVPMLATLAARMATYDLLTIRALAQMTVDQQKGNPLFDRLKEARDWLDQIADGKRPLIDSTGAVIAQSTALQQVWSNNQDYNQTFHEGPITDTVQDSDKITDLLSDRSIDL